MKGPMNDTDTVFALAGRGYCCSQIMVKAGLDARGEENDALLDAVAGLCGGLHAGLCCGILTGAACLLSLVDKNAAAASMIPTLVGWFRSAYEPSCGGIECRDILGDTPPSRSERCPAMMAETLGKCRELLAGFGYEL